MPSFDELIQEELSLPYSGGDFSIIRDRSKTHLPIWDYKTMVRSWMTGVASIRDHKVGASEVLSSLILLPILPRVSYNYPHDIPLIM
jgi:hypothetical protein